jgi:hypothetical protein
MVLSTPLELHVDLATGETFDPRQLAVFGESAELFRNVA